ncbi:MAG: Uma2 family endonuclease [Myxococcales bacterium]|nr:Uma2 family endonuclease [Myxococcales bacterium]
MLADLPRRRFTADEVLRMVDAGILDEHEPVELIDGELIAVSPQGPRHRALTVRIRQLLERAFGAGFHVQDHSPIAAGPASMPEPDVAVVRGAPDDFMERHPGGLDLALVVEISVTSQKLDGEKAGVYASAAVPAYWQVDVPARRVRAYADPVAGEYRSIRLATPGDTLEIEGWTVGVDDLLP